jgi:tetratricopeptide (TPR) repeat protein
LRSLLRAKRYVDLSHHIESFEDAFESDPRNEYWPSDSAEAFATAEPELLPQLDAWATATPDSFAPFLARGAYWMAAGQARRGGKWAAETHASNFEAMHEAHEKALAELEHALRIRPRLVAALRVEISVLNASSKDMSTAIAGALKLCPTCFIVRVSIIKSLAPRWGGSYEKMLDFANNAPVAKNPRLRLLRGYVDLDEAELLHSDEKLDKALAAIEHACSIGEHWEFLMERAKILERMKTLDGAQRDIDRAAELRPGQPAVLAERARIELGRKEFEAAGHDLMASIRINPTESAARSIFPAVVQGLTYQGWEFHKAGRKQDALRLIELATDLDPQNHDAQQRRVFLIGGAGSTSTSSEVDSLKANASAQPDDFRAHQALDYALAKQRRFDDVVAMWSEYLERHPQEGRGYLERGGAYWNLGRRAEAKADAAKACELAISEGCARAK